MDKIREKIDEQHVKKTTPISENVEIKKKDELVFLNERDQEKIDKLQAEIDDRKVSLDVFKVK